jgi:iron complex outermembrane receptor protein
MRISSFLLASIIILISAVFAQEMQTQKPDSSGTSNAPQYTIATIVVTATRYERPIFRVPYAINVIEQREIQRAQAGLSLDETLRAIPGVVVNNRFNPSQGDRISIRGAGSRAPFGVRGIKIILDGVPLTMPDGQSQLNNLDLGSVGKIEVLRGPSSSLYGNAAGGLINIQTDASRNGPFLLQPQFIFGSFGLRKWQGKASSRIGQHTFLANFSQLELEGYREHSAARSTSLNMVNRYEISKRFNLTTVFNYYDAPYLLNPSSLARTEAEALPSGTRFFVKQQGAGKKTKQGQGGVTLKYNIRETSRFESTIYGLWRSLFNPIPGQIIDLDRTAFGIRSIFSQHWQLGDVQWRGTIGADFEFQNDTRVEFENLGMTRDLVNLTGGEDIFGSLQFGSRLLDQQEHVSGIGQFAELEFMPNIRWTLTFGGRFDYYRFKVTDSFLEDGVDDSGKRSMQKFSPMIGLAHRPGDFITFYGNYATAFQTPTTTELSNRPSEEGGFNPDLQPETICSVELGAKGIWPKQQLSYDLAVYAFEVAGILIPYQIQGSGSEEVFFRNAGKAQNKGMDMKLEWNPINGIRASFAYTFMHFEFKDYLAEAQDGQLAQLAGKKIPGIPSHRFFAGLKYEHNHSAFFEINGQWMDRYFANDFNGPPENNRSEQDFINDAYFSVDLRLGFQRKLNNVGLEIFLGINNLFDQRYNGSIVPNAASDRFFEPAAGRSWYIGSSVPFSLWSTAP